MPQKSAADLEAFLKRQDPSTLVAVLVELAGDHPAVQQRLARMQLADRPGRLAAGFRKTLSAWRRSTKFYVYRESREFGRSLEAWLDQVERELLPKDPASALALFEAFIEADASWFERADDSDGCIGDAVRAACRHWLHAAARCGAAAGEWPQRLVRLVSADEYGAREELLRRADLLLDESELRGLVARFEALMTEALAGSRRSHGLPHEVYKASAALSLLAEALHDPDVMVRAVRRYSPEPNAQQRHAFARAYLEADRAADALAWLQGSWGHLEDSRRSLLSNALGRLGRYDESAPIRQNLFERSLSVFELHRWLEHLPEASRPAALQRARQLALDHDDPTRAAVLLLELGDAAAAESKLISESASIRGENYAALVPLAEALRTHQCCRGETAVYRALLRGVLDRAQARAYGHAARYWSRLREIASTSTDLLPLQSHEDFEAEIRSRHARKVAFWAHVNGKRRGQLGAE
jgi:hypothetical protein